jgi:hypothetical protein
LGCQSLSLSCSHYFSVKHNQKEIFMSRTDTYINEPASLAEGGISAISWPAILGGTLAAIALSLILMILGSALELSSVSPWSRPGSIASFTVKAAIWLIIMQWVASGVGGYLSGRLRTKWTNLHGDEVFFRDTAHGFLAWAAATVITAGFLASATASAISGGVHATATVASGAAMGAGPAAMQMDKGPGAVDPFGYYVDGMLRSNTPNPNTPNPEMRGETSRILMNGIKNGAVPEADKAYLVQVIEARSGLSQEEASKRVDDTIAQINTAKEKAKTDAEEARKLSVKVSMYVFISLLIGAFIASAAAALGGRHRDEF